MEMMYKLFVKKSDKLNVNCNTIIIATLLF